MHGGDNGGTLTSDALYIHSQARGKRYSLRDAVERTLLHLFAAMKRLYQQQQQPARQLISVLDFSPDYSTTEN
jgi:hypothetical protein